MPTRTAEAKWNGNLREGKGQIKVESGAFEGSYSFPSRFESGAGTNPEELIAAAHAGCFSMALSATLSNEGFAPEWVHTTAKANLEKVDDHFEITWIELNTEANVPGIDEAKFLEYAEKAKVGCPVSRALAGTQIKLNARLLASV